MVCWNVRSLNNKTEDVMIFLTDNNIDIGLISETWLTDYINPTTSVIKEFGYNITHSFRTNQRGGGVAIIYKPDFDVKTISLGNFTSFEYTSLLLKCNNNSKLLIISLYRLQSVLVTCFLH